MRFISLFTGLIFLAGCAKAWYVGEWVVTDVRFPTVSALGADEAREWFGSRAVYSDSHVSFRGERCESPKFELGSYTESDFIMAYRTSFVQLGIEGDSVSILRVTCTGVSVFPGSTLVKVTNDMIYAPWEGAFFRLDRQS